jgi:hypothetical protein
MQLFTNKLWRKTPRFAEREMRNKHTMVSIIANHFSFKAYQILIEL